MNYKVAIKTGFVCVCVRRYSLSVYFSELEIFRASHLNVRFFHSFDFYVRVPADFMTTSDHRRIFTRK